MLILFTFVFDNANFGNFKILLKSMYNIDLNIDFNSCNSTANIKIIKKDTALQYKQLYVILISI